MDTAVTICVVVLLFILIIVNLINPCCLLMRFSIFFSYRKQKFIFSHLAFPFLDRKHRIHPLLPHFLYHVYCSVSALHHVYCSVSALYHVYCSVSAVHQVYLLCFSSAPCILFCFVLLLFIFFLSILFLVILLFITLYCYPPFIMLQYSIMVI